jgi:heme exporter protein CcmD
MSLSEFLHMDGYAMYVWPAFVVTFVVLAANVATARRREAAVIDRLRRRRRVLGGDA